MNIFRDEEGNERWENFTPKLFSYHFGGCYLMVEETSHERLYPLDLMMVENDLEKATPPSRS